LPKSASVDGDAVYLPRGCDEVGPQKSDNDADKIGSERFARASGKVRHGALFGYNPERSGNLAFNHPNAL
jgi:hypothetical protein